MEVVAEESRKVMEAMTESNPMKDTQLFPLHMVTGWQLQGKKNRELITKLRIRGLVMETYTIDLLLLIEQLTCILKSWR